MNTENTNPSRTLKYLWINLVALLFMPLAADAFYNPATGRWLSRDPMEERSGANLHQFIRNSPISIFDVLGLYTWDWQGATYGVRNSHREVGGRTWGATIYTLSINKLEVDVGTVCKCCIKELDLKLSVKMYLPSIGDTLVFGPWPFGQDFSVDSDILSATTEHENIHVQSINLIGSSLSPKLEGDCKGKCLQKVQWHYWSKDECRAIWMILIQGEKTWITDRINEVQSSFHSLLPPQGPRSRVDTEIRDQFWRETAAKLAAWRKHKFCSSYHE